MDKIERMPVEVSDVGMAFGGRMETLLPTMAEIPDGFKRRQEKWNDIVSKLFFSGLPKETEFFEKPGIDAAKALRHIAAIMRSFEPKHEHKEAGCAYLLSLWFDDVKVPKNP